MLDGLRLALTTFTVAPLRVSRVDRRTARAAMLWSPLVGAAMAGIAGGIMLAARVAFSGPTVWVRNLHIQLYISPVLAAVLAVITLALLSRGLHLDGLTDTADGLGSHKPAEGALAIMSDGPIGALGAATLVLVLLTDVLALGVSTLEHHGTQALVMAVVTGRLAMLWSCTPRVPAAKPSGLGATVAGVVPRSAAAAWTLAALVGAAFYGRFDSDVGSTHGAVRAVIAVIAALLVAWLLRWHIIRRLGGVTGDVLGALCEIAVAVSLLVSAGGQP